HLTIRRLKIRNPVLNMPFCAHAKEAVSKFFVKTDRLRKTQLALKSLIRNMLRIIVDFPQHVADY
ncbi:MAG: hypothetical protein ACK5P5_05885, partial [Pseudobdellovibrionaceae bacterium]